ncbi:MAG: sugar kinase [Armatimonadota bacterium]|nr:sugar kinase [Armatimonadota bacterium]MCX7778137.1 sugar kinase [Armatimonadota bacterium]MDW8024849.1 sugar kinase [Armatimonadota bacterium]
MEVIAIGEMLAEIMRPKVDMPLYQPSEFIGPFPSGAPTIFADQVVRLRHSAAIVGAVGNDDFGKCILERLQSDGVTTRYVKVVDELATGVAFVAYFSDGSRRFIFHFGNSAAGCLPDSEGVDLSGTEFIHICGCTLSAGGRMQQECYKLVERASSVGVKISFDPNLRPELLSDANAVRRICEPVLRTAYVVSTGRYEAFAITGADDEDEACNKLLGMGIQVVAMKLGERGCRIYSQSSVIEAPPFKVDVVDPTGAGDCFDAAIVVGLIEGMPLEDLARLANACGALATTRLGPMEGAFWREDVERFLREGVAP